MSSSQKKGKEHSRFSERARRIGERYLGVGSGSNTRLGSRPPPPARTSDNALTAKDQRSSGEQAAPLISRPDVISKSAVVATKQLVATSGPPKLSPRIVSPGTEAPLALVLSNISTCRRFLGQRRREMLMLWGYCLTAGQISRHRRTTV